MTSSEKDNKRKGFIGTILFHSLILVAFLFIGLTYQDPPPPEEGISINFGFSDKGIRETEPEDTEKITEIEEEIIEQQIESTKEIITQSDIQTTHIKEKEKENPKEEIIEEIIEEIKPELNEKASYTGKKKNRNNSKGNKNIKGNQGDTDGNPDSDTYEGSGIGEDGIDYRLGTREMLKKTKPIYNKQEEGIIIVTVHVDREGNVIYANPGVKGSTTQNEYLKEKAKQAALKTKYEENLNGPEKQIGEIKFHFVLEAQNDSNTNP